MRARTWRSAVSRFITWTAAGVIAVGFSAMAEENPVGTLPPHDEGAQDPSFKRFRERLLTIVSDRDAEALSEIVADDIHMSFGMRNGRRGFVDKWRPGEPDSSLWSELETVLELGGSFHGRGENARFCAPYVFTEFPSGLDAFHHQVVTRSGVAVRARPDRQAEVIRTLDYAIVRTRPGMPRTVKDASGTPWVEIRLDEGVGYVRAETVRSPIDYRACFVRMEDGWRMTIFIAGD